MEAAASTVISSAISVMRLRQISGASSSQQGRGERVTAYSVA